MTPEEFTYKSLEEITLNPSSFIVKYPSPSLFEKCQPIEDLNTKLAMWQEIAKIIYTVMIFNRGCGLAAPQIGLQYRLFVLTTSKNNSMFIFNPEILEKGTRTDTAIEGCLSIPGEKVEITRPRKIKVRYFNNVGKETIQTYEGLTSRIFQHEIDHLDGILIKNHT